MHAFKPYIHTCTYNTFWYICTLYHLVTLPLHCAFTLFLNYSITVVIAETSSAMNVRPKRLHWPFRKNPFVSVTCVLRNWVEDNSSIDQRLNWRSSALHSRKPDRWRWLLCASVSSSQLNIQATLRSLGKSGMIKFANECLIFLWELLAIYFWKYFWSDEVWQC